MKPDILSMTPEELTAVMRELGERDFRAAQLYDWMMKGASFDEMTNLPAALREKLRTETEYRLPKIEEKHVSRLDGTVKYLFDSGCGLDVEAVYIPDKDRATLCVSSQAGCKMHCAFCMTGRQGFHGNLTTA